MNICSEKKNHRQALDSLIAAGEEGVAKWADIAEDLDSEGRFKWSDLQVNPQVISQKVFMKSFCRSQFWHKSVNSFYISVALNGKLMDLCGN